MDFNINNYMDEIRAFYLETNELRDETIEGNYVDWDNFRKEKEEDLLSDFGIELL